MSAKNPSQMRKTATSPWIPSLRPPCESKNATAANPQPKTPVLKSKCTFRYSAVKQEDKEECEQRGLEAVNKVLERGEQIGQEAGWL